MKGIVFNLLEGVMTRDYGEGLWDTLLEADQLHGIHAIG